MNNRIQQRFDRSVREAVKQSRAILERDRSTNRRAAPQLLDEPRRVTGRMQLILDPQTGGTVLVPWNHPEAMAWRAKKRQRMFARDLQASVAREGSRNGIARIYEEPVND